MSTCTLETVMAGVEALITAALASRFNARCACTRNISEDDKQIGHDNTPRAYLARGASADEDSLSSVTARTQIIVEILTRIPKDGDAARLQTKINESEYAVKAALLGPPGSPISFAITTPAGGAINVTAFYKGTDAPEYGLFDAYTDIRFELQYQQQVC